MLGLLIVSAIIGGIVYALSGIGILFWVITIFLFICGLPFTLVDGYIQDKIDYVQDREDYRQLMSDLSEEERMDRYFDRLNMIEDERKNIYIDKRQVNFNFHEKNSYVEDDDIQNESYFKPNKRIKKYFT